MIIDISHHQEPSKINYDVLAKQIKLAIIRTQYGSKVVDRHYKTHHRELQSRGIPTACYAWVRGVSIEDMQTEATNFYNRTKEFNPTFWFLDVEEESMPNMRMGISAYVRKLRELGVKKVGAYIGHHLYKQFNLKVDEFDAVWIPRYGRNDGTFNSSPEYPCDIHQFTDRGKLAGYGGHLDLNRLTGTKPLEYFAGKEVIVEEEIKEELINIRLNLHGKDIEVEGIFQNDTNYIPVKFLRELGYNVGWDNKSNTVTIEYK